MLTCTTANDIASKLCLHKLNNVILWLSYLNWVCTWFCRISISQRPVVMNYETNTYQLKHIEWLGHGHCKNRIGALYFLLWIDLPGKLIILIWMNKQMERHTVNGLRTTNSAWVGKKSKSIAATWTTVFDANLEKAVVSPFIQKMCLNAKQRWR